MMYSTCLFCTSDLGRNDVLETLPIGRRIAFDAAAGRLWVICPSCAGWNLVPFDTRLETIDVSEGMFREARLRFSTDHIGLARLREGLELVRIGPALRPEFAAWRYGDRFANRRRRNLIVGGAAGVVGVGAVIGAGVLIGGVALCSWGFSLSNAAYRRCRIATLIPTVNDEAPITLSLDDIDRSEMVRLGDDQWGLSIPAHVNVRGRWTWGGRRIRTRRTLVGVDAVNALAQMLPAIAGTAGSVKHIRDAVELVEGIRSIDRMLADRAPAWALHHPEFQSIRLALLEAPSRLAIEMLAHEESERRWLTGELRLLEARWRAADRLAGIADELAMTEEARDLWRERTQAVHPGGGGGGGAASVDTPGH